MELVKIHGCLVLRAAKALEEIDNPDDTLIDFGSDGEEIKIYRFDEDRLLKTIEY